MRLLASIAAAIQVPLIFWIGGFDFDHRGEASIYCYILAVFIGAAIYMYPGWPSPTESGE